MLVRVDPESPRGLAEQIADQLRAAIATEHAWLSPLPPEGASLIVHGDVDHAPEMATRQRIRAVDLLADGVVQHVVPEVDGESAADLAVAVAAEIGARLRELTGSGR